MILCFYYLPHYNQPLNVVNDYSEGPLVKQSEVQLQRHGHYSPMDSEPIELLHSINTDHQSDEDLPIPVEKEHKHVYTVDQVEDINPVELAKPDINRVNTAELVKPDSNTVDPVEGANAVDVIDNTNVLNHSKREEGTDTTTTEETSKGDLKQDKLDALLLEESKNVMSHNEYSTSNVSPDQNARGYILPFTIFEEQTNGAKNLWQLQILANKLGMKIVEPFAMDSVFLMDRLAPYFNQTLRFGDYFDKSTWNEMAIRHGGNPLVEWENFLSDAPRDVILLYFRRVKGSNSLIIDEHTELCGQQYKPTDMKWLEENFHILKRLCYRFPVGKKHFLTIPEFISQIFGEISPNEVTLIIRSWLGVRPSRIDLRPISPFLSAFDPNLVLPPSKRILKAFEAYKSQNIGNKKYVGIVFRTHHVFAYNKYAGNFTGMSQVLLQCSRQLKEELDTVRDSYEIFMACDLGLFGSKKYSTYRVGRLLPLRDQIYQDVFNGSVTVKGRDEKLKEAAGGLTDRGFMAELERVIATNADCIILLGAKSGFVNAAARSYISLHPGEKCIIPICFNKVLDSIGKALSRSHILT